jgi:hypothetical protein
VTDGELDVLSHAVIVPLGTVADITRQLPMTDQPRIDRIGRNGQSGNQLDNEQDRKTPQHGIALWSRMLAVRSGQQQDTPHRATNPRRRHVASSARS